MKYDQLRAEIEQIRRRYDLAEVIPATSRRRRVRDGFMDVCFLHADTNPSLHIVTENPEPPHHQFYFCFGCHIRGDIFDYVRLRDGVGFRDAVKILNGGGDVSKPTVSPRPVVLNPPDRVIYTARDIEPFLRSMGKEDYEFFQNELHIPADVVKQEKIGTMGRSIYTFPSFDFQDPNIIRAIMRYDPKRALPDRKWTHNNRHPDKREQGYIFRAPKIRGKSRVILMEGGKDALRGVAEGYDTCSLTNGALSWQPEYAEFFDDARELYVWLDWDASRIDPRTHVEVGQAGQRGTMRVLRDIRRAIPVDWNVAKEIFGIELYSGIDAFDWFEIADPWDTERLLAECKRRYA